MRAEKKSSYVPQVAAEGFDEDGFLIYETHYVRYENGELLPTAL